MKGSSSEIPKAIDHFLADMWVLYVKTLNFHWNMQGEEFFMYHRLLEEQYKELAESIDEVAERIRMLGAFPNASMEAFLKESCLKESAKKPSQKQMVQELAKDHHAMSEHAKELIHLCESKNDPGSADLLIKLLRSHDKQAWLLISHLK